MENTSSGREARPDEGERQKRTYVTPALVVYGDLTELTRQKGRTGPQTDNAAANNNKTL